MTLIEPILAKNPSCKLVILTGFASVANAIEAIKLGAIYVLQKPSRFEQILDAFCHTPNPNKAHDTVATGIADITKESIQKTLIANGFNITKTAQQLGLHRRTLQRKLKKNNF